MNIEESKKYIGDNVDFFIDRLAGLAFRETLASRLKEFQIIRGGVFLRNLHTQIADEEIDMAIEKIRKQALEDFAMYDAINTLIKNDALDDYTRTLASIFLDWRDVKWRDVSYELIEIKKPKGLFSLLSAQNPSATVKIAKIPQVIVQFLAAFERFAQAENINVSYSQMTAKYNPTGYGSIAMAEAELYAPFTFEIISRYPKEIDNQVNRFINNQPSILDGITDNLVITVKLQG